MISFAHAAETKVDIGQPVPHGPLEDPTFWVLVAFLIVVVPAIRPVGRMLATFLDARSDRIKAQIEEARALREEAQEMLATFERRQKEAAATAQDILEQARHEVERLKQEAATEFARSVDRREAQARDRIAQAEAAAIAEVRAQAVDLATTAAAQVIRERLSANAAEAMVDDLIKTLPQRLQ